MTPKVPLSAIQKTYFELLENSTSLSSIEDKKDFYKKIKVSPLDTETIRESFVPYFLSSFEVLNKRILVNLSDEMKAELTANIQQEFETKIKEIENQIDEIQKHRDEREEIGRKAFIKISGDWNTEDFSNLFTSIEKIASLGLLQTAPEPKKTEVKVKRISYNSPGIIEISDSIGVVVDILTLIWSIYTQAKIANTTTNNIIFPQVIPEREIKKSVTKYLKTIGIEFEDLPIKTQAEIIDLFKRTNDGIAELIHKGKIAEINYNSGKDNEN